MISDQADTSPSAAAPPAPGTPDALYAASLLLTSPEGHAAAAVIANDPVQALAVALRTADRERDDVVSGRVAPVPIDDIAVALLGWLLIADQAAIDALAAELLIRIPTEQAQTAWTTLRDAIEARAQISRRRSLARAADTDVPAAVAA